MSAELDLSKFIETRTFPRLVDDTEIERPHIRGRRIPVATIAHCAQNHGWGVGELAYNFGVSESQVLALLLYYEENSELIEAQEAAYQEDLDEAYYRAHAG